LGGRDEERVNNISKREEEKKSFCSPFDVLYLQMKVRVLLIE
jgi:hypothetical protein